jgi:hypothetical protein
VTIHRVKGLVAISCDECPETFEMDTPDFHETWAAAKDEGWVGLSMDGEYQHHCPGCAKKLGTD